MKKNYLVVAILAFALFFVAPMTAEASETEGLGSWRQSANGWWFETTDGGYLAGDFYDIDGVTYYFDDAGWMKTGWVLVDEDWFFFNNSGAMVKGWLQDGADWYYMDPEYGYMWTERPVDYYYVGADGKMLVNDWIYWGEGIVAFGADGRLIENSWYYFVVDQGMGWVYFGKDAELSTGWLQYGADWYYLNSGVAAVGTYIMEYEGVNHLYQFATDGRLVADKVATQGWISVNGYWFYYDGNDLYRDGWYIIGGEDYYFEYSGELTCNGTHWDDEIGYYLFNADGKLARNEWVMVNGYWAYGDENGVAVENDWCQINGTWYYFDWIEMVDAPFMIDNKLHLFASSGAWLGESNVSTGWVQTTYGYWYYLENMQLATGWRQLGGKWYYFDTDYYYAYMGDYWYIDDVPYVFDNNCAMVTGWYETEWGWCYSDANGVAFHGDWMQVGSTWYYFDGFYMSQDGMTLIDDVWHLFGKSGAWLGEVENLTTTNGWKFMDGSWYYVEYGEFVDGLRKINGQVYGFYNGRMITNDYALAYTGSLYGETILSATEYIIAFDGQGHIIRNQWYYLKDFKEWIWLDNQGFGTITASMNIGFAK